MTSSVWGTAVLAVALTVAVAFTAEDLRVVELGESASGEGAAKQMEPGGGEAPNQAEAGPEGEGAAGAVDQDKLLTPWDKQGLAVIKSYADYNNHLQDTEKKLREQLANPPDNVKGIDYQDIPGYKYDYLGRTMEDKSQSECELVCSSYSACKSYSYNARTRECVWSMAAINYNPDYTMYIKKLAVEGDPKTLYNEMPGMFIQGKKDEVERGAPEYQANPGPDAQPFEVEKEISFDECKYECTNTAKCKTFSYGASTRHCVMSAVDMHYEPHWTYFEKDIPVDGPSWKQEHAKENAHKEELKARWIAGSTMKARARLEKETKAAKLLKDTVAQQDANQQALNAAKKVADEDRVKCSFAEADVELADKSIGLLQSDVEHKTASIKAQELLKETYERQYNKLVQDGDPKHDAADLHMKIKGITLQLKGPGSLGDAVDTLEKEIQSQQDNRDSVLQEKKSKVCGTAAMSISVEQKKEGIKLLSEAAEKKLMMEKHEGEAHTKQDVAKAHMLNMESSERKAKMQIAVKKSTYEGECKAEEAASTEISKKKALQAKSDSHNIVREVETKGEKQGHLAMVAKEAFNKAKENFAKLEEKHEKATNLVATRKRESNTKGEALRVRKKLKIKKEADTKSEYSAKNLKKEEMIEKAAEAKKQKGEVALKGVEKNEADSKHKMVQQRKEWMEMKKMEIDNEKAAKDHKVRLDQMDKNEKDAKYKVRNDELKVRTLTETLNDARNNAEESSSDAEDALRKASQDEQSEKAAAAMLRQATTEAGTKKMLRSELSWKSVSTNANEHATKSNQQKMLAAEDVVQAQAKLHAEKCIHTCIVGLKAKKLECESELAQAQLPVDEEAQVVAPAAPETVVAAPETVDKATETVAKAANDAVAKAANDQTADNTGRRLLQGAPSHAENEMVLQPDEPATDVPAPESPVPATGDEEVIGPAPCTEFGEFTYEGCTC